MQLFERDRSIKRNFKVPSCFLNFLNKQKNSQLCTYKNKFRFNFFRQGYIIEINKKVFVILFYVNFLILPDFFLDGYLNTPYLDLAALFFCSVSTANFRGV